MHRAPCDEMPRGSMPKAASGERNHHIEVATQSALAIVSKRIEYVVAQPVRQRNMPTRPKLCDADRSKRCFEVRRQVEAKHFRDAQSSQRIPSKVAIHLHRKRKRTSPRGNEARWIVRSENNVRDRREHMVGTDDLQKQPTHEHVRTERNGVASNVAWCRRLSVEIAKPHNRSRYEMREERHEQAVVAQIFCGRESLFINVCDV